MNLKWEWILNENEFWMKMDRKSIIKEWKIPNKEDVVN